MKRIQRDRHGACGAVRQQGGVGPQDLPDEHLRAVAQNYPAAISWARDPAAPSCLPGLPGGDRLGQHCFPLLLCERSQEVWMGHFLLL